MTAETKRSMPEIPHNIKKIHIVGIVGTAMGSLAAMLKEKGFDVRGSDAGAYPPMSTWLDKHNIPYTIGYKAENLDWNPDLVVIGNVVRSSYPDAEETIRRKLPYVSLPELLRHFFLGDTKNFVISGTHGKTTTSSILAWILYYAKQDPSFFIGGVTGNFDSNYRLGNSDLFVIEGDEYDTAFFDKVPKFWHYKPTHAVINNIEFDHADIYNNIDELIDVFHQFAEMLPPDGTLWINGEDQNCHEVAHNVRTTTYTFGLRPDLDLYASHIETSIENDKTSFQVIHFGENLGTIHLPLIGSFNVRNALAAIALAIDCGISFNVIQEALPLFKSTQKRQQLIADINGIKIFDDFAHHPTAVANTINAFRSRYPGHRIIVVFEIKSNTSHRAVFQKEYADALSQADQVILAKAWKKINLPPEQLLNFDQLIEDIEKKETPVELIPEVPEIVAQLTNKLKEGDIVLGLSGSSFDGFHHSLAQSLRRHNKNQ